MRYPMSMLAFPFLSPETHLKRPICLISFLLFYLPSFAQGAPMKYGKVPKEDLDMKVYPLDTSAAAVVLCDYGNVTFEFPDEEVRCNLFRHKRIKILKRTGFGYGDIEIPFYKEAKIKTLRAQVIAPDGTETEVPKKDIFEEKINDNWSRIRFAFPNLREGSVVEYKYDFVTPYIFELPEWYFQGDIPVRWSEMQLEIPIWYQYVSIYQGRPLDIAKTESTKKGVTVTRTYSGPAGGIIDHSYIRMVMKEAPALKEESYITTMDDYFARVRFQLSATHFSDERQPVMGTWHTLATKLMERNDIGHQISKKSNYKKAWQAAQPYLADATTPDAKIQALYKFVQNSFEREDGNSIYARKDLDELYEKKTARSSEMNLLLVALLNEAGVKAHPMLISTREHGQPITEYPVIDQFDHLLAMVESGDKPLLLEAGNPFRPAGLVGIHSLNQEGWVVHPTEPRWIEITPSLASETFFGTFQLDEEGNLTGKVQTAEEGYEAMKLREQLSRKSAPEYWKAQFQKRYPDASLDSVKVEGAEELDKMLQSSFRCSLPSYAQVSGDFIYLNPMFFSYFNENPFKLERREYPVDMPYPFKERLVLDLALPPGYQVESLPEPARLTLPSNRGRFLYNIEHKEGKIKLNCTLYISQLRFMPGDYDALRTFFGMVAEKLGEQVVLKKT